MIERFSLTFLLQCFGGREHRRWCLFQFLCFFEEEFYIYPLNDVNVGSLAIPPSDHIMASPSMSPRSSRSTLAEEPLRKPTSLQSNCLATLYHHDTPVKSINHALSDQIGTAASTKTDEANQPAAIEDISHTHREDLEELQAIFLNMNNGLQIFRTKFAELSVWCRENALEDGQFLQDHEICDSLRTFLKQDVKQALEGKGMFPSLELAHTDTDCTFR